MRKIYLVLLTVFAFVITNNSSAQGCSDAGVCTLHPLKNSAGANGSPKTGKNDLSIGVGYGKGERSTNNYSSYLEYTRNLTSKTSVTGKFSYNAIGGELANTSGPGDLFLSLNHVFDSKNKWKKSFVVGLKLPFDGADISGNGINLPMPYQPSLGTTDIVFGINYSLQSFGATLAVQQPLKPINKNKFLPGDYPGLPLASKYWPTNRFSRKGDIVGRVSYNISLGKDFSLRPSILGIYHLANDTYEDEDKNRRPIYDSKGLTLNGNIFIDYKLKNGNGFELSLGAPFVVRDQRPDGLTRHFVASIEYQFSF